MGNLWDDEIWEDEAEYRQAEDFHREYNPDQPELDIMETY